MKIVGIVQARYSSTRLPGKVLRTILGKPMLLLQLERLCRSRQIDRLIVATSDQNDDDVIEDFCLRYAFTCHRGSLDDVLDRFYQAVSGLECDGIVRLTGDCPLIDPDIVDGLVDFFVRGGFDYASNTMKPTWPDGLDAEVMRPEVLKEAWEAATLPSEREHVTPYIYKHPERFELGSYENSEDRSSMRWTVDEEPDFLLVKGVYEALYPSDPSFSTPQILNLLEENPELARINCGFERNEGYRKSLQSDNPTYIEED